MLSLNLKLTYYIGAMRSMNRVQYSKYQSGIQGCDLEAPHMCHLRIIFLTGDLTHYIMSFTYIINSNGIKSYPCGTPLADAICI